MRTARALAALVLLVTCGVARADEVRDRAAAAFVERWRSAWVAQDIEAFLALHAPDYRSGLRDLAQLADHKRRLFARREMVSVQLGDLLVGDVTIGGEKLVAAFFDQDYRSSSLSDFGRKELVLRPVDGAVGFEIVRETWLAAEGPIEHPLAEWLVPAPIEAAAAVPTPRPSPSSEDVQPLLGEAYLPPSTATPPVPARGTEDLLDLAPLTREQPALAGPIPGLPPDDAGKRVIEEIVARVNGRVLTRTEFIQLVQFNQDELFRLAPPDVDVKLESVAHDTLEATIERWLLVEQAHNWQYDKDALWREFVERQRRDFDLPDEAAVRRMLVQQGYPVDLLKDLVVEHELSGAILRKEVSERIDTSEPVVQAYFEAHRDDYRGIVSVHLRQILVPVSEGADPQRALSVAELVLEELKAGSDWCALARLYGPEGPACGDLGVMGSDDLAPELKEAAEGLPIGATSKPIRSAVGFHLVQITERSGGESLAFEAIVDRVRKDLYDVEFTKRLDSYLAELRREGQIVVNPRYEAALGVSGTGEAASGVSQ